MAVRLEDSAHRAMRRERAPVLQEAADQLGGEVLRLGGAAAVADREQPAAGGEHRGQLPPPGLDQVRPGGQGAHAVVQLGGVLVEPDGGRVGVRGPGGGAGGAAPGPRVTRDSSSSVAAATWDQS